MTEHIAVRTPLPSDRMLVLALALLLAESRADKALVLALLYIAM